MRNKIITTIVILSILITSLVIFYNKFASWIDDPSIPHDLPINSKANTLTITSNGCCFFVEDITISIIEKSSEKETVLAKLDRLNENDIFKYKIQNIKSVPFRVMASFKVFYGDEYNFYKEILEFDSISELKENGILLYFQEHDDMYLNVISGEKHISYKKGDNNNRWVITETPNKIYAR